MTEIDMLDEFGGNLQSILDEIGMSQIELAKELHINKSTVNRYIRGECMPSLKTIINIMDVTGCEFNDLICEVEYVD